MKEYLLTCHLTAVIIHASNHQNRDKAGSSPISVTLMSHSSNDKTTSKSSRGHHSGGSWDAQESDDERQIERVTKGETKIGSSN